MSDSPSIDNVEENTAEPMQEQHRGSNSNVPKVRAEGPIRRKSAAGRRISVTEIPLDQPKNIPGEEINANYKGSDKKRNSLEGRRPSVAKVANDEDDARVLRVLGQLVHLHPGRIYWSTDL